MGLFQNNSTFPDIHLDMFIQSVQIGSKIRMKPVVGQVVENCFVECSRKTRVKYPVGTIFKIDCRLVRPSNRKPYLMALQRSHLQQAIEFYEHNRMLMQQAPIS